MQGKIVLAIDDDPELLQLIKDIFSRSGAQVYTAPDGEEGLRQFFTQRPDLVIIDVMMPEMDGWEVCTNIRRFSDVPIMMLTALGKDEDIMRGLNIGADEYITKPFSPPILVARARATMRRAALPSTTEKPTTYDDGHLAIDLEQRLVAVHGEAVKLTPTEYRLLGYMIQNANRVLTFQQILEKVWGWEYQDSVNYVHVYIWHLRQKLEKDPSRPQYLITEHRVGYWFQKHASATMTQA